MNSTENGELTFKSKQTVIEYFDDKILKTETKYYYENPTHGHLTKKETIFPSNSVSTVSYHYAHEKNNQYLIDRNMVGIPLQTTVSKTSNGLTKTVSNEEVKYPVSQTDANSKTSGFPLPFEVLSYDLQTGAASKEVTYDRYDPLTGNLQQYTTKSGIPVSIIWGYNNTQPIAKVEGAIYGQIQASLIADIVAKSNADVDQSTEDALLNSLDAFRNNTSLSGYQITTYTYNPLIGVTSITPPSGIRETYRYDSSNRHEKVIDANGNILKEYKYNYKQ